MFRSIRVRLALSYAGIALLVTLSLGGVLLIRLRAYYSGMDLAYLNSNAKAISSMAVPLLIQRYPVEVQAAQASNLAFLSQARVRILDPKKNVLADSGPVQATHVGIGVVQRAENQPPMEEAIPAGSSAVIFLQKDTAPVPNLSSSPLPEEPTPRGEMPYMLFFNRTVKVNNSVYGFELNGASGGMGLVTNQIVQKAVIDPSGALIGYVELSESPAYGQEVVSSVASGLAVAGSLAIFLAIATGWLTANRFTTPLLNLTHVTQEMSGGNLSARVGEVNRGDEFGILGNSFNQMAERIEETVQTLRRFLADAAHELQTPMTALRTNLELAKGEGIQPETESYLKQAMAQLERMQHMIQDLLILSRLESAAGREDFQNIDLNELIRQVGEPYAARAEQAGQAFDLELSSDQPWVEGSPDKLGSAIANLLDNALKFTPPGGAIRIGLEDVPEGLALTVVDTGIGIPREEVEMLFNRFHRGRNASAYPGSGLGLAIVRAIIHAHHGAVQASNNPGGGASFRVVLPRGKRDLYFR